MLKFILVEIPTANRCRNSPKLFLFRKLFHNFVEIDLRRGTHTPEHGRAEKICWPVPRRSAKPPLGRESHRAKKRRDAAANRQLPKRLSNERNPSPSAKPGRRRFSRSIPAQAEAKS